MAQAFVDLMNKVIHSFSKFTEHLLCARQSKEAEHTVLRSTRSLPAAAFHRQDSAENRHPSTFSDLDGHSEDFDPSLQCSKKINN